MKTLCTCLLVPGLLTACQPSNQSKTMPGLTTTATSRFNYRLVFIKQERKYEYNHELYLRDFEAKVNQAVTEGWQPIGGVAMAGMGGFTIQAMMKID